MNTTILPRMATPMEDAWMTMLRDIVISRIDSRKYAVFVYGSRAAGTAVRSSDVDIGIWGEERVPTTLLAQLHEEIDESAIPFHYDIVDFSRVDEAFKEIALEHIITWNQSTYFDEKLRSYSRH